MAHRFVLSALAASLLLLIFSQAAAADPSPGALAAKKKSGKGKKPPKKCKAGKVLVKVGRKTRCLPVSKALPQPKAGDPREEVITEALTPDIAKIPDPKDRLPPPMEQVYRKLGPQALKGMEQSVGVALDRLEGLAAQRAARPGTASASAESGGSFSQQFGNVTIDARLSVGIVGSELVGRVEFGVDHRPGGRDDGAGVDGDPTAHRTRWGSARRAARRSRGSSMPRTASASP